MTLPTFVSAACRKQQCEKCDAATRFGCACPHHTKPAKEQEQAA